MKSNEVAGYRDGDIKKGHLQEGRAQVDAQDDDPQGSSQEEVHAQDNHAQDDDPQGSSQEERRTQVDAQDDNHAQGSSQEERHAQNHHAQDDNPQGSSQEEGRAKVDDPQNHHAQDDNPQGSSQEERRTQGKENSIALNRLRRLPPFLSRTARESLR